MQNTEFFREEMLFLAKAAEQAERFEEMAGFMRRFVEISAGDEKFREFSQEEANLLAFAYKNAVNSRRAALRVLESMKKHEEIKEFKEIAKITLLKAYKHKIEEELAGFCKEIIAILQEKLLKTTENMERKCFYLKISGDFYRYLLEISAGTAKDELFEKMQRNQAEAIEIFDNCLHPCNPKKLGLALSSAAFSYEILNEKEKACLIAKKAFEEAIAKIEEINEEDYRESTTILQMLRDYVVEWENMSRKLV